MNAPPVYADRIKVGLKILLWPNPALKTACSEVDAKNDLDFQAQLALMENAMLDGGGVGLAANQVGILKRMLVAKDGANVRYFVNPRIVEYVGVWGAPEEGCLSLPGIIVTRKRNTGIVMAFEDLREHKQVTETFTGQLAHVLQHEVDHLNGKTMIDDLPSGRKDQLRAYMRRFRMRGGK